MSINVMIVDDQRLMREGLKAILDLEKDIVVTALAENGQDALDKLEACIPDVVLMDIRMPVMDGVQCTLRIRQKIPEIKVLILTVFDDDEYIIEGLKNGAIGYLLKDLPSEKLVGCIRDAYHGRSIMQPEIAAKLISHITGGSGVTSLKAGKVKTADSDGWTEREQEVLRLVAKGCSNKEIAKSLFISEATVKNYISSIYDKIGVNERAKVIIYAIEHGYL